VKIYGARSLPIGRHGYIDSALKGVWKYAMSAMLSNCIAKETQKEQAQRICPSTLLKLNAPTDSAC
jgi:hypothetical protein